MRILLTNDDGIRAPGIVALYEALVGNPTALPPFGVDAAGAGEPARVFTVAPLTVQSATGHGVTFHTPLMVTDVDVPTTRPGLTMRGVAVDGRPADCVKLAVSSIWPERVGASEGQANGAARDPLARDPDSASGGRRSRPDLLISGMNAGANCGINVIYSGTVAAALEGAFLGIPSIAVSMMLGRGKPRFDVGALRARRVLDLILRRGLPKPYEVISINIPVCEEPTGVSTSADGARTSVGGGPGAPPHASRAEGNTAARTPPERTPADQFPMPPVRVCGMNTHGLVDAYERRVAPSGEVYYWAAGHGLDFHATEPESDVDLLKQGCITVTPLKYDLTKHEMLKVWRERVEGV